MKTSLTNASNAVHAMRVACNLSTKDLAAMMKISNGSISKMENGDSNVTVAMCRAYEKALAIPENAMTDYIRVASKKAGWLDTLSCAISFRKEWMRKGHNLFTPPNNP